MTIPRRPLPGSHVSCPDGAVRQVEALAGFEYVRMTDGYRCRDAETMAARAPASAARVSRSLWVR